MANTDKYVDLITSEHQGKPKFEGVVRALTAGFSDNGEAVLDFVNKFDLDQAVGSQLDDIGLWVGVSRRLPVPIIGVYFAWNDTALTGWGSGIWRGPFDPVTGLYSLPDDIYRKLIRARIAANQWDGTIPGAIAIWALVFDGGQTIIIQDNQNMTMVVGFVGPALSAVEQALLTGGYVALKPSGVRISYYAIPPGPGPLFAWNASSPELDGWGSGSWATQLTSLT